MHQIKEKKNVSFFEHLTDCFSKLNSECNTFICGDFNTVVNNSIDIISGDNHDTLDINILKSFIQKFDLHDIWRLYNPNTKDYTWSKNNPFIARRLDFIFCNNSAISNINKVEHLTLPCSDHRAVLVKVQTSHFIRGPGIWRFNNSLLCDKNI